MNKQPLLFPDEANAPIYYYPTPKKEIFYDCSSGLKLPYNLILPTETETSGAYPLLILLHGAGERGDDNDRQRIHVVNKLYKTRPELMARTVFVAPQCPNGMQWVDTPWADGNYSVDAIPESRPLAAAIRLLASIVEKYPVDPDRIYIMGLSMGGFGTWDALTRHPELFAAGVPICGNGDPSKADILKDIPIYTAHGTADNVVFPGPTAELVNAIRAAGGEKLRYDALEGVGHNAWDYVAVNGEVIDWLFTNKLSDR